MTQLQQLFSYGQSCIIVILLSNISSVFKFFLVASCFLQLICLNQELNKIHTSNWFPLSLTYYAVFPLLFIST